MTMNLDRHLIAHKDLFLHLVRGDGDSAEKHREFYDEYLAVMTCLPSSTCRRSIPFSSSMRWRVAR